MIDPSLKILFCAFQVVPEPSGTSARLSGFLRALQGKCTVDALTAKSPEVAHIERHHGARLMRVPVGAGDLAARSQAFERAVRRQLESDEYQIIQFSDPFAGTALLDLKSKFRFKAVYDACTFPSFDLRFTDPHLEGDRTFVGKLKRSELLCLMGADAILTASPVHRDHIASLGVPRQKITVLPPSVDLAAYEKLASARPDRIPMRLLYLGSQAAWQGLPTLLFALKDALKQPAAGGVRLSVVGPNHPDWRGQLDEQVKASGLSGNVDFVDPPSREDLARLIAQHDVGVAPLEKSERNQQMPGVIMKLAEYAATGRAIIASDLPVTRAMLDERAALFFPPSREPALSQAIVALAKDPQKRVQMGQAARALAAERCDGNRSAAKLLEVYAAFGLHGTPRSGEHEIDAATAVGALAGPDAAEVPPELDTGRMRTPFAETGRVAVPFEPTPTGAVAGVPIRAVTEPHAAPGFELAGSEPTPAELRAAPPELAPQPNVRNELFGDPASLDEQPQGEGAVFDAPGEEPPVADPVPAESPPPDPSAAALLGELDAPLLGELVGEPAHVAAVPHDEVPPTLAGELVDAALPSELFGLAPAAPRAPERLSALSRPGSRSAPPAGPPVLAPAGPPVLAPSRASVELPGLTRPRPPTGSMPVLAPAAPRPASGSVPVLAPAVAKVSAPSMPQVASPPPVAKPSPPPPPAVVPPPVPTAAPIPAVAAPPPIAAAIAPPRPPPAPPPIALIPAPPPLAPIAAPPPIAAAIAPPRAPTAPSLPVIPAPPPLATIAPSPPIAIVAAPPPIAAVAAPLPVQTPAVSEVMELDDGEFSSLDEPELLEPDAVEAVEPPPKPVLQNSVDLGGPDRWFHSLVLGFAPLGQLGAAPIRGSPLSNAQPPKI